MTPTENDYWYLGTPYSKYKRGIDAAFADAMTQRAVLIRAGIKCFSPIVHTHPVAVACNFDPLDWRLWMDDDKPFVHHAFGMIVCMLDGWQDSKGVTEEINIFHAAGKPVIYMVPDVAPAMQW